MLKIENLDYDILQEKIVKNFSIKLDYGDTITLFGASGCGKTTILRLISKIETPKNGLIFNTFKKTAYLFQENRLFDNLNVIENIMLCMEHKDKNIVMSHLNLVGFTSKDIYKYPYELSGGMAKRVAFMRAFLSGADLLLLDEPFVGLDTDLRTVLANLLIEKLKEKSIACMLVTHERNEAIILSSKVLFLSKKQMKIEKSIEIRLPPSKRDFHFIEQTLKEEFRGVVYYD